MPHIHWVARGTGIPKDRDEVNRREKFASVMGESVMFFCMNNFRFFFSSFSWRVDNTAK